MYCISHFIKAARVILSLAFLATLTQAQLAAQDSAQVFLEEVREKYELPFLRGLESFSAEISVVTKVKGRLSNQRDTISYVYSWKAPNLTETSVKNIPGQFSKMIHGPVLGIWKDIAGGSVFPDLEGKNLLIQEGDEGMEVIQAMPEGFQARVIFDPDTKSVLKEVVRGAGREIVIVPSYETVGGIKRLVGKVVTATGLGGEAMERQYTYTGFNPFNGYPLPALLTVNFGKGEVVIGLKYTKINGQEPEMTAMDEAEVKEKIKDFKKRYAKMSASEKIDAMKALTATKHEKAADAIAQKGLKDKDLTVRKEAARLLGHMGCRNVVTDLTKAMKPNDQNTEVYVALIEALGDLGDPKAIPFLSKDFWNQKDPGKGARIAKAKIDALGMIRSKKSVDTLIDLSFLGNQIGMARFSGNLTRALQKLTGQQIGWDRDAWKDWWKKNRAKFKLEEDR